MNREEIEKKIDKMQSLEERQILKELLQQVLDGVIQYQEKEYAKIKQSLCEEIPIQRNRYYIASAIIDKSQYYGGEWLYPVLEQDEEEKQIDWNKVKLSLQAGMEVRVGRVFAKIPMSLVRQWKAEAPEFFAVLQTTKRKLRAKVELRFTEDYMDKLEELENAFGRNGISWEPIHMSYFLRFFDLNLIECMEKMEKEEDIISLVPDYGEYQDCILEDQILLWNLRLEKRKAMGFPVPQLDQKKYKFSIPLDPGKTEYIVLLKDGEYVVRKEQQMEIYSENGSMHSWNCYVFEKKETNTLELQIPVLSNASRDVFSNRFAHGYEKPICTKAQLERMVQELQVENFLQLEDIKIITEKENKEKRMGEYSILQMQFSSVSQEKWLAADVMQYIGEAVQQQYYEFQVTTLFV